MGQAKQRGTFEERLQAAQARKQVEQEAAHQRYLAAVASQPTHHTPATRRFSTIMMAAIAATLGYR